MSRSAWDRVEGLAEKAVKMWSEGMSATDIASRLGNGLSRNAVLGKIHRLGFADRGSPVRRHSSRLGLPRTANNNRLEFNRKPAKRAKPANENLRPPRPLLPASAQLPEFDVSPIEASEELDIPIGERKQLVDLEPNDCRWPIGDPRAADFHFCNRSKVLGLPYCEFHARKAFVPVRPRERHYTPSPVSKTKEKVDA